MIRKGVATVLALLLALPGQRAAAQTEVDLELVLLADASLSIDDAEIRFQREGYAAAITHSQVLDAIARGVLGRIAVTFVEWGYEDSQEIVVPWSIIDGPAAAASFANALLATPRRAYGMNAIGSALAAAHALIEGNDIAGLRRVIDLSADSANNWAGIPIATARSAALAAGLVINGLAILCREDACSGQPIAYDLVEAFKQRIIGGPGSFVVTVDGNKSFAEAVRRKLLLEMAGPGAPPAFREAKAGAAMQRGEK